MENSVISIEQVADYFLTKKELTPKKIQKLVYYAYAWFIALNNQDADNIQYVLFDEEPEAWIHGPVFPSLYNKYRDYGFNEVSQGDNVEIKNEDLISFLDEVWKIFGKYSADELEYMKRIHGKMLERVFLQ